MSRMYLCFLYHSNKAIFQVHLHSWAFCICFFFSRLSIGSHQSSLILLLVSVLIERTYSRLITQTSEAKEPKGYGHRVTKIEINMINTWICLSGSSATAHKLPRWRTGIVSLELRSHSTLQMIHTFFIFFILKLVYVHKYMFDYVMTQCLGDALKGYFTNFTHESVLTDLGENYCMCVPKVAESLVRLKKNLHVIW